MLVGRGWDGGWRTGSSNSITSCFRTGRSSGISGMAEDGFSALVNYHRLDRAGLERLTYTYLGWWIDARRADVANDVAGAEDRLAAAEDLQDRLELILEGEPPFDIYVRWKTSRSSRSGGIRIWMMGCG